MTNQDGGRAPLRSLDRAAIAAFVLIWLAAIAWLYLHGRPEWQVGVISMALLGVAFPALAWWLTRSAKPPAIQVPRPALQAAVVLAYVAAYFAIVLVWGFSALRDAVPEGKAEQSAMLIAKLVTGALLPALLLLALGNSRGLFAPRLGSRTVILCLLVLAPLLVGLLAVVTPSLQTIATLNPSPATLAWVSVFCFVWVALEAGLVEEILYRVTIQTSLAAWLKSEGVALAVTTLIFGLAHVPGLFLRGDTSVTGSGSGATLEWALAYAIGVQAPGGILFGVLWLRTRSLGLVVLLHASVNFLPNLPDFLKTWGGAT